MRMSLAALERRLCRRNGVSGGGLGGGLDSPIRPISYIEKFRDGFEALIRK
jgi:hypothetical protein